MKSRSVINRTIKGIVSLTLIVSFQNCGPGETSHAAIPRTNLRQTKPLQQKDLEQTMTPSSQGSRAPSENLTNAPSENLTNAPSENLTNAPSEQSPTSENTLTVSGRGSTGKRTSLLVNGIMAERSNPNLYLLSHHKAPSLTIALPKNATSDKNQLTLTKLRGNCPLQTPKTQTLPISWQEAAPSSEANQGEPTYVAAIPYLQSREVWNEQLQGCDFEIKIQGQVAGQPHEFKVILDARFCSDGEHTQLSQFAKDCQVRGPTRNYPKVTTLPAHHSHGLR